LNPREQGFLLLTGYLGDPERKPLTVAQFRELTKRARNMERPQAPREMTEEDLIALGCSRSFAQRVLELLSQKEQLHWYLQEGKRSGCVPITRVTDGYPQAVRRGLSLDAPGVLWAKGDLSLLDTPMISLVGSRELKEENRAFAEEVGKQAAMQGYTLVSGDARGADRAAQQCCLENGGKVISVVADDLQKYPPQKNVLLLSEEGFDLGFSPQRALQRNRVIHCLGSRTFVAQCRLAKGGTWDGTAKNLKNGWSPVFCFRDESPASFELAQMGAVLVDLTDLQDISNLQPMEMKFTDQ
jgi:predicted Rossmann fold nucleotide-binding protein DprA/Smf involved in DNA uptake